MKQQVVYITLFVYLFQQFTQLQNVHKIII